MTINTLFPQIIFFCFFIVFIVITVSYKIPNVLNKGMKPLPCRWYDNIDMGTFNGEKKSLGHSVLQEVGRCHSCMLSYCISCKAQHVGWSKQGYTQMSAAGCYELK